MVKLTDWDMAYLIMGMFASGFYLGVLCNKIFGKKWEIFGDIIGWIIIYQSMMYNYEG